MKNRNWIIAGAVIALLIIAYICGRCSTKQERDNAVNNIIALRDTVNTSTIIIDGLQTTLSEKQALILTQKEALATSELEKGMLKKLHLKDVVTNSQLTGEIKILRDSLELVPGTIIYTVDDTTTTVNGAAPIPNEYVKIPFTLLDVQEDNLHLLAGMSINKHPYFSLSVPFSGSMTVGYKKAGLFKTTPVGIFTTTNPYIKISDMNVVIIQQPNRLIDKWWLHVAVGGAAALTIQHFLK